MKHPIGQAVCQSSACYTATSAAEFKPENAHPRKQVKGAGPDSFGNMATMTGNESSRNPFRFSTKYTDDETELVYYGYRYYSPELGRWVSRDPIGEQGASHGFAAAQSETGHGLVYQPGSEHGLVRWISASTWGNLFPYRFAHNSPVSGVDILGLQDAGSGQAPVPQMSCGSVTIKIFGCASDQIKKIENGFREMCRRIRKSDFVCDCATDNLLYPKIDKALRGKNLRQSVFRLNCHTENSPVCRPTIRGRKREGGCNIKDKYLYLCPAGIDDAMCALTHELVHLITRTKGEHFPCLLEKSLGCKSPAADFGFPDEWPRKTDDGWDDFWERIRKLIERKGEVEPL